jgi:hypothetical protein
MEFEQKAVVADGGAPDSFNSTVNWGKRCLA